MNHKDFILANYKDFIIEAYKDEKLEERIKVLEERLLETVTNKDIHNRLKKIEIEFNSRICYLEYKMGINPYE